MLDPVLAWHFLPASKCLSYGPHTPVEVGRELSVNPPLRMCRHGLHASPRALDAFRFFRGPIACRVELSGELLHGPDKICAERRKVLWMADVTPILPGFFRDVIVDCLPAARDMFEVMAVAYAHPIDELPERLARLDGFADRATAEREPIDPKLSERLCPWLRNLIALQWLNVDLIHGGDSFSFSQWADFAREFFLNMPRAAFTRWSADLERRLWWLAPEPR